MSEENTLEIKKVNNKLPIITADERLNSNRGIKGCILGISGIGKTSLLWTLPEESTLFIDLEAGDLAVANWAGDTLRPRTWQECRDFAVYLGGPNLSVKCGSVYSKEHYTDVCNRFGDPRSLDKYGTIFIDSITVAGRLCLQWSKNQPSSISDRTGKEDTRAAYGLHGSELITWLTHLQHIRNKNVWFVGILEEKTDDYNRKSYALQIDGSKASNELPGIVDQVITLAQVQAASSSSTSPTESFRAFVCHTINPHNYPAKDRSGKLDMLEPPHLGKLMEKIRSKGSSSNGGEQVSKAAHLNYQIPQVLLKDKDKDNKAVELPPSVVGQSTALTSTTLTNNYN